MNEGDLTINDLPTVSEKKARQRERAAFEAGATSMYIDPSVPYSPEAVRAYAQIARQAVVRYPNPKRTVTRPREVDGGLFVTYRLVDGEFQFNCNGVWRRSSDAYGDPATLRPELLRAMADLIENPTETVEIPDDE